MQVTLLLGTVPFDVEELNVQLTASTTVSTGRSTVTTALVNDRAVMFSSHCGFGPPGASEWV